MCECALLFHPKWIRDRSIYPCIYDWCVRKYEIYIWNWLWKLNETSLPSSPSSSAPSVPSTSKVIIYTRSSFMGFSTWISVRYDYFFPSRWASMEAEAVKVVMMVLDFLKFPWIVWLSVNVWNKRVDLCRVIGPRPGPTPLCAFCYTELCGGEVLVRKTITTKMLNCLENCFPKWSHH